MLGLGTYQTACPFCGLAIEVPLHTGKGKTVGDHVEYAVTADAEPLTSHAATHRVVAT